MKNNTNDIKCRFPMGKAIFNYWKTLFVTKLKSRNGRKESETGSYRILRKLYNLGNSFSKTLNTQDFMVKEALIKEMLELCQSSRLQ